MQSLFASLRVAAATIAVCVIAYTAVILLVAQTLVQDSADGSLITDANGNVVGSRLIAQKFADAEYFWPRPSAVDYNGAGAGGSNKSPTSAAVAERAQAEVARHGATAQNPLPPELATASGGGLDPHISEHAARYQVARVAAARGRPPEAIEALIDELAFAPGGPLTPERIVNVLELNLALQRLQ
jgi:K+-transporting ATPase ATPase C chain